jgi:glycosyltransferase involved in cell wall biosynthesis
MPVSMRRYLTHILIELGETNTISRFAPSDSVPSCDVLWDPRAGQTGPFWAAGSSIEVPKGMASVASFHGAAVLSMPWHEVAGRTPMAAYRSVLRRRHAKRTWKQPPGVLIAVSEYAAHEARQHLRLDGTRVIVAPHGVDANVFRPAAALGDGPFLHYSSGSAKKNTQRIVQAHGRLGSDLPPLQILGPASADESPHQTVGRAGNRVRRIEGPVPDGQLVAMIQQATALVFPSLHETFGLPILEAMACGTPVITSRGTGCEETAGGAAFVVNPRVTGEIASAMRSVALDVPLRGRLRSQGLARAGSMTWRRSAELHRKAFQMALDRS